jgi:hypothetical protein
MKTPLKMMAMQHAGHECTAVQHVLCLFDI